MDYKEITIITQLPRAACHQEQSHVFMERKGSFFFLFAINFAFTAAFKPRFFPSLLVFFPPGREREASLSSHCPRASDAVGGSTTGTDGLVFERESLLIHHRCKF